MTAEAPAPMRFLCFGVGAIGTYLGGSLALAGHPVVFLERPGVACEVCERGLSVQVGDQVRRIENPLVVESISEALQHGPFDAAILAVKSFDTPGVIENFRPYAAQMPPVISFQNGVENEHLLAEALGRDRTIAATVTTAVGRPAAGSVVVERLRGTGIAVDHPLGAKLVSVMDAAGLRSRAYPNPAAMKWSKLLTNLLANASSAILNMTPDEIFARPDLYRLEAHQLRETLAVMRAQQIPVVDLPATQVRALAFIVSNLPASLGRLLLRQKVGKGRGAKMPSFHIDLYSGRGRSEVESLNGAVVRFGQRVGIETPVNQAYTNILLALTRGEMEKSVFARQPEKFIAAICSGQYALAVGKSETL